MIYALNFENKNLKSLQSKVFLLFASITNYTVQFLALEKVLSLTIKENNEFNGQQHRTHGAAGSHGHEKVRRSRNTAADISKLSYNREVDEQNKSFTSLLLTMN